MVFKWCVSKMFSNYVFQTVSKISYGVSMVFKLYVFKMCFKVFSNCVFQTIFKLYISKCFFFSKFIIGFKVFSNYVFQWFSKLQNSSKCFKLYVGNFETHNLKTIETCGELWKYFETRFEKIQFEIHWNLLGIFENTLKHIIWKHFETHHLKTLWNTLFENTLKHIIWKPFKPMGDFLETLWNTSFENHWKPMGDFWKHFETYHLKTLWNTQFEKPLKHLGDFWKHFENYIDTPLSCHHSGVTIETLCFQLALKWNTWGCAVMHGKKNLLFSRCWKYRLHNYRVKQ